MAAEKAIPVPAFLRMVHLEPCCCRIHMNIADIRAFVAVAETGSVNRAAHRLNLTQPAVTRRIQSFEAALGEGLVFDRTVKPAVLTATGQTVLDHCRRVLHAVSELKACAKNSIDPSGELRVGVAHGLGEFVLTTPLDAVRSTFGRIRLQVSSNWTSGLIVELRSGRLDCAIGLLTEAQSLPDGLLAVPLGAEQVVIVSASKPALRGDGQAWRLKDLGEENWYLNPTGCGCRAALERAFGRKQMSMQVAAEVFGEDLQMSLIAHSGGLGLVPSRLFHSSPYRNHLQVLEVQDFILPATVALIKNSVPGRFDAALALFADRLQEKLQATPSDA